MRVIYLVFHFTMPFGILVPEDGIRLVVSVLVHYGLLDVVIIEIHSS